MYRVSHPCSAHSAASPFSISSGHTDAPQIQMESSAMLRVRRSRPIRVGLAMIENSDWLIEMSEGAVERAGVYSSPSSPPDDICAICINVDYSGHGSLSVVTSVGVGCCVVGNGGVSRPGNHPFQIPPIFRCPHRCSKLGDVPLRFPIDSRPSQGLQDVTTLPLHLLLNSRCFPLASCDVPRL